MTRREAVNDVSRGIDPETAEEVLRLAARFQDEAKSRLSMEDLTGIAGEAGIEPRFVQMALAVRRRQPVELSASLNLRRLLLLSVPSAAYVLSHLMIDSVAWGESLFTTLGPRELLASSLLLGTTAALHLGATFPRRKNSYLVGLAVLVLTSFLLRIQAGYGWDLSLSLHSTLAFFMLTFAGIAAFSLAHAQIAAEQSATSPREC